MNKIEKIKSNLLCSLRAFYGKNSVVANSKDLSEYIIHTKFYNKYSSLEDKEIKIKLNFINKKNSCIFEFKSMRSGAKPFFKEFEEEDSFEIIQEEFAISLNECILYSL